MTNQTEFSRQPLSAKQWRAITYNYLGLATYGDTSRFYCLTDFQVAWIMANLPYYNWKTRWYNDDYTQEELDREQAELENALMSCYALQPYQLTYIYDLQQAQELDELQALWDDTGTPDGVNPNTPNDYYSGDDSTARLDALCTACKIYVYSYAQNWLAKASLALGIVALVGLASSITIVGGIIASVLVGGLFYITSIAMDAMQDTVALNKVACCMRDSLNGVAITQANFEIALGGCGFGIGTNEAIIRDIISSDLGEFKNWLAFINQLGNSYVLAQIGVIDCPCDDTWVSVLDFTVSDYDFVFFDDGFQYGHWDSGVGLKPDYNATPRYNWLAGGVYFDPVTITGMRVEGTFTRGYSSNTSITATNQLLGDNDEIDPLNIIAGSSYARVYTSYTYLVPQAYDHEVTGTFNDATNFYITFRPRFQGTGSLPLGDVTITKVTLTGVGFKPSQLP